MDTKSCDSRLLHDKSLKKTSNLIPGQEMAKAPVILFVVKQMADLPDEVVRRLLSVKNFELSARLARPRARL